MANWTEGTRPQQRLKFNGKPGLRPNIDVPPPDKASPIDFCKMFLEDEHNIMAEQTNIYADQYLTDMRLAPNSRYHGWKPTDAAEMKVFIALLIAMGLVVHRDVFNYWTLDHVMATPFFFRTQCLGIVSGSY